MFLVCWQGLEVRDDQGGDPLDPDDLRITDSSGTSKLFRLWRHEAFCGRSGAFGYWVGVMPASGRVLAVERDPGSQIPPAPVPKAEATAAASGRPPFEVLKGLGHRLIVRREQRGLTRQELADCLKYPDSAVAAIEHGLKPGPRTFWALADRALGADGSLLADADRSLLIWSAAMQDHLNRHHHAARKAARPRQATPARAPTVDRVFADELGAVSVQARRPPQVLAAVERCRPRIERELAALTDAVRVLVRRTDFADPEIFACVWQALLRHDPREAALVTAVAVVELARARFQARPRF